MVKNLNSINQNILSDNSLVINYNIAGLPLFIQRNEFTEHTAKKTVPHWNEELVTVYVHSGCLKIVINGEPVCVEESEICVINAGCVHYYVSTGNSECVFYVGLANETLFSSSPAIYEKYIFPLFHSFHPNFAVIRNDYPDIHKMRELFGDIITLLKYEEPGYEILIVARFHEYLALLYRFLKIEFFLSQPVNTKESASFRSMLNYIYQNYSDKLLIDEIASIGGVSRKHCYNLFRKYTSCTPAEYITTYRLHISKKLLANPELTIANIAVTCGFTHQSHFTNHFTKYYGITPNQYRHNQNY